MAMLNNQMVFKATMTGPHPLVSSFLGDPLEGRFSSLVQASNYGCNCRWVRFYHGYFPTDGASKNPYYGDNYTH